MRSDTRHELKQDKFVEATSEAVHWTQEHRNTLLTVGGILLAVVLLGGGGYAWMQHRDQAASIELSKAMRTYEAPVVPAAQASQVPAGIKTFPTAGERAKAAQKEFEAVANNYGSTKSGDYARYLAGVAANDAGDMGKAEETFKKVADSRGDLGSLGKFALANLYRAKGNEAEALKLYKELENNPTNAVSKVQAQLASADMQEEKNPGEARKIYEAVSKENPNSPAAQFAQQKLQTIKQ